MNKVLISIEKTTLKIDLFYRTNVMPQFIYFSFSGPSSSSESKGSFVFGQNIRERVDVSERRTEIVNTCSCRMNTESKYFFIHLNIFTYIFKICLFCI